jgi:hypothetical protein
MAVLKGEVLVQVELDMIVKHLGLEEFGVGSLEGT